MDNNTISYNNNNNNNKQNTYIKVDNNKIINEKCIRWIKKIDECLYVCSKPTGCIISHDTHTICKINSSYSYNKFNKFFD
jgi:hypothetical protein